MSDHADHVISSDRCDGVHWAAFTIYAKEYKQENHL